ncbi:MAG: ribosome maturation factor RimP [Granulosicoccaceae bacterium]
MRRASINIVEKLEPIVSGLDYEFVGAEMGQTENGQTLRIYIDKPEGIDVEDCATVSRQINAVIEVEEANGSALISSAYLLEVSSPGVDRPLFTTEQFAQHIMQTVKIKLLSGVEGRRNFKGKLVSVGICDSDESAVVEVDGLDYVIPLNDIAEAYLLSAVKLSRKLAK